MLILTRDIGESIIIGDDIKLTILQNEHSYHQVKIGIDAPRKTPVYRKEIYEKIQNEKADC